MTHRGPVDEMDLAGLGVRLGGEVDGAKACLWVEEEGGSGRLPLILPDGHAVVDRGAQSFELTFNGRIVAVEGDYLSGPGSRVPIEMSSADLGACDRGTSQVLQAGNVTGSPEGPR